jgi:large subunit ribosomal protein L15
MLKRLRPPKGSVKNRRRLGRGTGSGRGKTAGRGHKGQGQRGSNPPPFFEGGQTPLIRRIPKRGFVPPNRIEYQIVKIKDIASKFSQGETVTPQLLFEKGLIGSLREPIKILADGEINFPIVLKVHAVSESARSKIESVGGKIENIVRVPRF